MRIPSTRRWTLGIGTLLLVGMALAIPLALSQGNAGDVKVHNPDGTGEPENHPHVGCSFFIEGFNMDAESGTITFKVWPPSGLMTVVHATGAAETWTSDETNEHGNHHFVSGPYSLPAIGDHPQGTHYKVFVSDTKHDKMKVFWVKCEETPPCEVDCNPTPPTPPCEVDCNPTPPTPPCEVDCNPTPPTPPTTEVPFFPNAGALAVGLLGAVGSVFVALRRKA